MQADTLLDIEAYMPSRTGLQFFMVNSPGAAAVKADLGSLHFNKFYNL